MYILTLVRFFTIICQPNIHMCVCACVVEGSIVPCSIDSSLSLSLENCIIQSSRKPTFYSILSVIFFIFKCIIIRSAIILPLPSSTSLFIMELTKNCAHWLSCKAVHTDKIPNCLYPQTFYPHYPKPVNLMLPSCLPWWISSENLSKMDSNKWTYHHEDTNSTAVVGTSWQIM